MKKKVMWILIAVAAVVVVFFLLFKKPAVEYVVLERTNVEYKILASCTVSFPEPYAMAAKAEGDVKEIMVAEGQAVKKGAILIRVDDFKERQNLTIAVNNYNNAKLKLVNAKEETYPRLKEQMSDAGSVLAEAKNNAERMQKLFAGGAVSKVDFENATTRLDAAQARFNQAKLQLDSYTRSGAAAELINQLNILNAQMELSKRAVAEKQFVAPYDCTVIKIDVTEGEAVVAGKKAVTVLEKNPWVLETNVDQKELNFLEAGLPCWVVFDAYPNEKVKAAVSLVCSAIDYAKGTCNLKLRVEENKAFIKHGMTGSVEISGKRIEGVNINVLALPAAYVVRAPEGDFVLVKSGRSVTRRALEFSPIGEKWVSVKNIPEGTRIVRP
ncbi:MAG TPA: HlyD family efflux transporter periplasmic adaptor subunit [Candidatus Binatia bacterium]|nr:HlyD family efflux transporter periplasmic adaptor subunit [Candidatus Binatia bacterium]